MDSFYSLEPVDNPTEPSLFLRIFGSEDQVSHRIEILEPASAVSALIPTHEPEQGMLPEASESHMVPWPGDRSQCRLCHPGSVCWKSRALGM